MKYLLAALSGMVITLCVFVGGAAFAITYLTAEPLPVERPTAATSTPAFPSQAVKVDPLEQDKEFDRLESRPVPETIEPAIEIEETDPAPEIDGITTASLDDPEVQKPATFNDDHVAWCSDRYRSYSPENNTYMSYSGEIRECLSPHFDDSDGGSLGEEGIFMEASTDETSYASASGLSPEHIDSCFARYRSYTPEDNTYQPYGGGPREQCQ